MYKKYKYSYINKNKYICIYIHIKYTNSYVLLYHKAYGIHVDHHWSLYITMHDISKSYQTFCVFPTNDFEELSSLAPHSGTRWFWSSLTPNSSQSHNRWKGLPMDQLTYGHCIRYSIHRLGITKFYQDQGLSMVSLQMAITRNMMINLWMI